MIGKLVSINNVTENYDEVTLQELSSDKLLRAVVEKGSCDDYISQYILLNTSVVRLVNANKDHEYPEGTIGYGKKGF